MFVIWIVFKIIIVFVIVIVFVWIFVFLNNIFLNEFNEFIFVSNKILLFNDFFCVIIWFCNCLYIVWIFIVNGIFIVVLIDVFKSFWVVFNIFEVVEFLCIKMNILILFFGVFFFLLIFIDKNILIKLILLKGIFMLFFFLIIEDKFKVIWNFFFMFLWILFKLGWIIIWFFLICLIVFCKWSVKVKCVVLLYVCFKCFFVIL